MGYINALVIYIIGGLTFLPLVLLLVFLHAHYTFPTKDPASNAGDAPLESLHNTDDDTHSIKSGRSLHDLAEKFQRGHEPDVASGYFAVCREYVPGGVNGKPPERTTPAGSVIATESPSVYQSMYRSLFDRKQAPTIHPGAETGRTVKRARNIFFVVLRHGHLMLYENSEQVEVKYVIAIEQYDVSIYSGEDEIQEGELWIRRNAIMLSRKSRAGEVITKPFFFFSENCSDKEDFYVALLQNQEEKPGASDNPPRPLHFDQKLAIGLVQRLHSSEEQLQTRWLNAMVGRLFLALYRTPEVEEFVRKKITKKIARAKKPAILSDIILRSVDMGESAPQVTNPRLKDLTIDGDCCAEMDIKYNGGFRLEIATTVRIDFGARFKAREVTVILAVVVKKLSGHALVKFKPPPSNRVWISFETMPDIEMIIEPLVSSRQITYGFILRTIEARIREVLAETLVLPHWDDIPFTNTLQQRFRGGIWAPLASQSLHTSEQTAIPDEAPEDEAETDAGVSVLLPTIQSKDERTMSMPVTSDATPFNEALNSKLTSQETSTDMDSKTTSIQKEAVPPKALRSRSFASAANPLLSMDNANVDSYQAEKVEKNKRVPINATSAMRTISNKSRPSSPPEPIASSALDTPSLHAYGLKNSDGASTGSHSSGDNEPGILPLSTAENTGQASLPSYTNAIKSNSDKPDTSADTMSRHLQAERRAATFSDKKQAVAAVNAATAAAKKWGWGVLNRTAEQRSRSNPDSDRAGSPAHPIGRGQPLPPPGQPLPFPEGQRQKMATPPARRRKPVPPPPMSQEPGVKRPQEQKARLGPAPPLPTRRRQSTLSTEDTESGGMLVVEAPPDPEPASPKTHQEDVLDGKDLLLASDKSSILSDNSSKTTHKGKSNDVPHGVYDSQQHAGIDLTEEDESIAAWQNT